VKTARPLQLKDVEPHDHSTRWLVRSRTGKGKYLVDLGAYNGHGECVCKDWQTRMGPILKAGMKPEEALGMGKLEMRSYHLVPQDACRCAHIMLARAALTDAFIKALLAAEKAQSR
jgi:hypothetical protein